MKNESGHEKRPLLWYYGIIIPVILGSGVRLFENVQRTVELRLEDVRTSNGITELLYRS